MATDKEEIPMDEDDAASSGSENDSDIEDKAHEEEMLRMKALDAALEENPYLYDQHLQRIELAKGLGELDLLRRAREAFAATYPLESGIWLSWLRDEQKLATSEQEKKGIVELFERAVQDYVSVDVWLEYCQFSIGGIGTDEGKAAARQVFETAIAAVGLNVARGAAIWEAYREFEAALFTLCQGQAAEEVNTQKERVDKIFCRQLTVPLLDMEATYEEYKRWKGSDLSGSAEAQYRATLKLLSEREKFETSLIQKDSPEERMPIYRDYLAFEITKGNPARIQALYERRITDNCLNSLSWTEYLDYLNFDLKMPDLAMKVHARSIRNITWDAELWVRYLRSLERYEKSKEEYQKVSELAFSALAASPQVLQIWMAFIDYRIRHSKTFTDHDISEAPEEEMDSFRALFNRALDAMAPLGADLTCQVARLWAVIEADRFKSMDQARTLWADVIIAVGEKANYWLEYAQLEKMYGSTKHLRKLFQKALARCQDDPAAVGHAWVMFEREEADFEKFELAERAVAKRLEQFELTRVKVSNEMAEEERKKSQKVERKKEKDKDWRREKRHKEAEDKKEGRKRKADNGVEEGTKSDGFKVPPPPGFKASKAKGEGVAPPPGFKEKISPPPGFKPDQDQPEKKMKMSENHPEEAARTVFLNNLDYNVDEEAIKEVMQSSGLVKEVRLIKSLAGKSKGYAYVEFESPSQAEHAIKRDHELLSGRPMFISKCDPEKKSKGHDFKYGVGMEKNKLFVKGLATTVTQEKLEEAFKEFGELKEVRIVTYRNGRAKGIAFVEFLNENEASKAVLKADGMTLEGKEISVALSNPPERKDAKSSGPPPKSLGGGSSAGSRGKGRSQVAFIPRSLAVAAAPKTNDGEEKNGSGEKPKSNADFRSMLLGKK